jgi:hypothetical protein
MQRALDRHLPVAEGGVGEDLRLRRLRERKERAADVRDILRRQLEVLLAQVLAQRPEPLGRVHQLHPPPALRRLPVGQHPDVRGDARVVEQVERQRHDGLNPVVLDQPAADVALALPGIAREQRRPVVYLGDAAAQRGPAVHLRRHVGQEEQLPIAAARDQRQLLAAMHHPEARVAHPVLAAQRLQILLQLFP